jgi:hypothetical protein
VKVPRPLFPFRKPARLSRQPVSQLSLGAGFALGVTRSGALVTRGSLPFFSGKSVETRLGRATHTACGVSHGLVLLTDGRVASAGDGSSGQLGHGDFSPCRGWQVLYSLASLGEVVSVACGAIHSAALLHSGRVYVWGGTIPSSGSQAVPLSTRAGAWDSATPHQVEGLPMVLKVACGETHTAVVTSEGEVMAWGRNDRGQCGQPMNLTVVDTPQRVSFPHSVERCVIGLLAAGGNHNIAVDILAKAVYSWGEFMGGPTPRAISALAGVDVCDVACGRSISLALTATGEVFCWLFNPQQQPTLYPLVVQPEPLIVALPRGFEAKAVISGYEGCAFLQTASPLARIPTFSSASSLSPPVQHSSTGGHAEGNHRNHNHQSRGAPSSRKGKEERGDAGDGVEEGQQGGADESAARKGNDEAAETNNGQASKSDNIQPVVPPPYTRLTLMCPITMEPFRDPVVAADGFSYEREAIMWWLRHNSTSPATGEQLKSKVLIDNFALKN